MPARSSPLARQSRTKLRVENNTDKREDAAVKVHSEHEIGRRRVVLNLDLVLLVAEPSVEEEGDDDADHAQNLAVARRSL